MVFAIREEHSTTDSASYRVCQFLTHLEDFGDLRGQTLVESTVVGAQRKENIEAHVPNSVVKLRDMANTVRMRTTISPGHWQQWTAVSPLCHTDEPQERRNSCPWLPLLG